MKNQLCLIWGVFLAIVGSAFGQAAVGYPQPAAATTLQPTLLTNVQIATISLNTPGLSLGPGNITNINTGITADTNAFVLVSNPLTPKNQSPGNLATNELTMFGVSSNGTIYLSVANFGTNIVLLPTNSLVKIKVESWQ